MSPEEIAASALAGMESSLSSGNIPTAQAPTPTTTTTSTVQEVSLNTNEQSEAVGTNAVTAEGSAVTAISAGMMTESTPSGNVAVVGTTTTPPVAAMKLVELREGQHATLPIDQDNLVVSLSQPANAQLPIPVVSGNSCSQTTAINPSNDHTGSYDNDTTAATGTEAAAEASTTGVSGKKPKRRGPKPKVKLPIEPRLIQCIPKQKEYTNHSYSDFSVIPRDANYAKPTAIEDMSFVEKMHDILSKPEYESYISWKPNGRTFGIIIPSMFEKNVCPLYFQHKRYSSFLRQLNNYGFKHLTNEHGPNRNCYYHECFLRNMEYLCQYMPESKDARRRIPDPSTEPNFDAISLLYPVPPSSSQQRQVLMIQQHQQQPTSLFPIQHLQPSTMTTATGTTISASRQMMMNMAGGSLVSTLGSIPETTGQQEPATIVKKMTMDRNTALAELKMLKAELESESSMLVNDSSATAVVPPVSLLSEKRKAMSFDESKDEITHHGSKTLKLGGGTGISMPQAFPNTKKHKKESSMESKFKTAAIRAAIQKQKEKEEQKQQEVAQQQQSNQTQQQQLQQSSFPIYSTTSLPVQGLHPPQPSQLKMQQRPQQPQPQQQFQTNIVSDYIANPISAGASVNSTYNSSNNIYNTTQTSYSQQNSFPQQMQFNNQVIAQQQPRQLQAQQFLTGNNVSGFQQHQQHRQPHQQQIDELRNQLLQGNNNVRQQPQFNFLGTSGNMNREDNTINGSNNNNNNNTNLRGGTQQYM